MNRIAIIMDGGLIRDILADEKVDITIVDYDIEGMDYEDLTKVPRTDGTSVEAFIIYEEVDTSDEAREYLDILEILKKKDVHDHLSEPG